MSGRKYLSNVVNQTDMRAVQSSVLQDLSDILINSFGPKGSNTCIKEMNALNMYTKDGYTILKHVNYNGVIEQSIKDDIESIARNVAITVGDGTSSAVLLSNFIFKALLEYIDTHPGVAASEILTELNHCCKMVNGEIMKDAEEATIDRLYDIALISANGNEWIADAIIDIYKKLGLNVFIDVSPSLGEETSVKYYDGMTINTGFANTCFITDTRNNTATIDHPKIFFFEDPIDTKEMGVLLDAIISRYITTPLKSKEFNSIQPVVIVCPHLSRDMSSTIDSVIDMQNRQPAGNKIPFLLITDTHQVAPIEDIRTMCGGRPIRKYIDKELYEKDKENGTAPTPYNVHEWAGGADQVVASSTVTKFINPSKMKNEDGTFTNEYTSLLDYVKAEIAKNKEDGEVAGVGTLKRRLHSLQSNLVEINVGGITVADRDSNRHLFEDAVLNCRSAAQNGIGWGANFSGYLAIDNIIRKRVEATMESVKQIAEKGFADNPVNATSKNYKIDSDILNILYEAYRHLIKILYGTCMEATEVEKAYAESSMRAQPINLRTMEFDGKVRSSIESDTIILYSVAKIVGIMVTCNQFIVPTPQHNVYSELKEIG